MSKRAGTFSSPARTQLPGIAKLVAVLAACAACASAVPASATTVDGTLTGQYSCSENTSPTSRSSAPFSFPIELSVREGRVSGKRENAQTIEAFSGSVDPMGLIAVELAGSWKDEPSRRWLGRFNGQVRDRSVRASGDMLAPDGRTKLRDCALTLTLVPDASPPTPSAPPAILAPTISPPHLNQDPRTATVPRVPSPAEASPPRVQVQPAPLVVVEQPPTMVAQGSRPTPAPPQLEASSPLSATSQTAAKPPVSQVQQAPPTPAASVPSSTDSSLWPWLIAAGVLSTALVAMGASLQRSRRVVIFKSYGEATLAIFLTVGVPLLGVVIWLLGTWFNAFKVVEASLAVPFFMGCAALLAASTLLVNSVRSNRSLGTGLLSFAVKVAFGVVGLLAMLASLALHQAPTRRDDESKRQFDERVSAEKTKAVVADAFMIGALALLGLALVGDGEADADGVSSSESAVDEYRTLLARVARQLGKINDAIDTPAKASDLVEAPPALVSAMITQVNDCSAVIEKIRHALADGRSASSESAETLQQAAELAEAAAATANILNQFKAMQTP